jgi:peptide/nickel transport system substrate-binding protein
MGPGKGPMGVIFQRRCFLGRLLLFSFLLLGLGCSKGADGPKPPPPEPVLRIGTTMVIKQANPVADYYYNILAMIMTHDSLVRFDGALRPIPQLALRFSSDDEGRVWTFDLNPQARWHDGHPVTPEDVKFTFEYLSRHHLSNGWAGHLIETIETEGHRVVFHLKAPHSRFLINAGFVVRILPSHIWRNITDPLKTEDPGLSVGCGPYVLEDFDPAARTVSFRANRDYYGPLPSPDRIAFKTYGTTDLLALALIKERVDLYYQYAAGMPVPYVEKLTAQPHLACMSTASMGIPAVLGFNLSSPLVETLAVRRAMALAVDYAQLNACLMKGEGLIPRAGLVPPAVFSPGETAPWKQNLAESRALLAGAGWKDRDQDGVLESARGVPAAMTLLVRSDLWGESQVVKLLARDFEKIGVKLRVRSADLSTYLAFLKKGAYDLVLFRTTPWGMMMHAGCGTGYFDGGTRQGLNLCRLKDETFFALCRLILKTTDSGRLKTLYAAVQRYYAEHLPAVALCWGRSYFPYNRKWQGLRINQLEGGLANRFSWRNLTLSGSRPVEVH